jgi:hypothetical protein
MNRINLKCINLVFFLILLDSVVKASDSIILVKPISIKDVAVRLQKGGYEIKEKNILIPKSSTGIFSYLIPEPDTITTYRFSNCKFGMFGLPIASINESKTIGNFDIYKGQIDFLRLSKLTGRIGTSSSTIHSMTVDGCDGGFSSGANQLGKLLLISNSKLKTLNFSTTVFSDSAEVRIMKSTVNEFWYDWHERSGCNISFLDDSVLAFYLIRSPGATAPYYEERENKFEHIFKFSKCYIDASFKFLFFSPNTTFVFDNCTFGKNASLGALEASKIVFRNCSEIPRQFFLSFSQSQDPIEITIVNTDVDNIRFDFTPNMILTFDSQLDRDAVLNSYKMLLEKYSREGRESSYKNLDLQYRKYRDSKVFHFINSIWWYHGYKPELVFVWTFFFLLFFYAFNLWRSEEMLSTYPVIHLHPYYQSEKMSRKKISTMFLYTVLIFFTLNISFSRLNFSRHPYVYMFLFQYLTGIWCLLFIIRYVLKL